MDLSSLEKVKTGLCQPSLPAYIYALLGEMDNGFEWLGKAYEQHDHLLRLLKVHPSWDVYRSDPRFVDLLQRMNFPEGDF